MPSDTSAITGSDATDRRCEIAFCFDPSSDPICGQLIDDHGHELRFTGWLSLACKLRAALRAHQTSAGLD